MKEDTSVLLGVKGLKEVICWFQVFPDASHQQRRDGVHGAGDVRVEHVPAALLGLLPRGRLLQEAVRGGTVGRRRRIGRSFKLLKVKPWKEKKNSVR